MVNDTLPCVPGGVAKTWVLQGIENNIGQDEIDRAHGTPGLHLGVGSGMERSMEDYVGRLVALTSVKNAVEEGLDALGIPDNYRYKRFDAGPLASEIRERYRPWHPESLRLVLANVLADTPWTRKGGLVRKVNVPSPDQKVSVVTRPPTYTLKYIEVHADRYQEVREAFPPDVDVRVLSTPRYGCSHLLFHTVHAWEGGSKDSRIQYDGWNVMREGVQEYLEKQTPEELAYFLSIPPKV